jgi:conjugative transfer signal peptidase TraF
MQKSKGVSKSTNRVLNGIVAAIWTLAIAAVVTEAFVVAPIYNLTGSVPIGLYAEWKLPAAKSRLHHAEYVVFCPTQHIETTIAAMHVALATDGIHGKCAGGRISFIKMIAALPGDVVDVVPGPHGYVAVDGRRWRHSAPTISASLPHGNPLASRFHERIKNGQLWLLGITRNSVDSRYFGPVPIDAVEGVAVPLAVHRTPYEPLIAASKTRTHRATAETQRST